MANPSEAQAAFQRLLGIMDDLRTKCPWDREQTAESLRKLTIEETYELADAIDSGDWDFSRKNTKAMVSPVKGQNTPLSSIYDNMNKLSHKEGIGTEEMGLVYVGNKTVDKVLNDYVKGVGYLSSMQPLESSNWIGQPGFDDEGNQVGEIDYSDGKTPRLMVQGDRVVIRTPMITKVGDDEIKHFVYSVPKPGFDPLYDDMLENMLTHAKEAGQSGEQSSAVIRAEQFNQMFNNNQINMLNFEDLDVNKGEPFSKFVKAIELGTVRNVRPGSANEWTFYKIQEKNSQPKVVAKDSNGEYFEDENGNKQWVTPNDAKAAFKKATEVE